MINHLALYIGYIIIVASSLAAAAFIVYLPINYAWKRFGDVVALGKVLRESKRQGRTIFKSKDPSHDNQYAKLHRGRGWERSVGNMR